MEKASTTHTTKQTHEHTTSGQTVLALTFNHTYTHCSGIVKMYLVAPLGAFSSAPPNEVYGWTAKQPMVMAEHIERTHQKSVHQRQSKRARQKYGHTPYPNNTIGAPFWTHCPTNEQKKKYVFIVYSFYSSIYQRCNQYILLRYVHKSRCLVE